MPVTPDGNSAQNWNAQGVRDTDPAYQQARARSAATSIAIANDVHAISAHNNLPFHAWVTGTNATAGLEANSPLLNQGLGLGRGLWRGRIRENNPEVMHPGDSQPYEVYFMFNPTDIAVEYGFNTDLIPPQNAAPEDLAVPLMTTGVGMGFSLLFDRTYEVWQGGLDGPGKYGCLWDVMMMEKLLGLGIQGNYATATGRPVTVLFGPEDRSIRTTGYFTQLSVTYGTFDMNMTPTRCRMDVRLATRYLPQDSGPIYTAGGISVAGTTPKSKVDPGDQKPVVSVTARQVPQ